MSVMALVSSAGDMLAAASKNLRFFRSTLSSVSMCESWTKGQVEAELGSSRNSEMRLDNALGSRYICCPAQLSPAQLRL
jgi:hypothetical protein